MKYGSVSSWRWHRTPPAQSVQLERDRNQRLTEALVTTRRDLDMANQKIAEFVRQYTRAEALIGAHHAALRDLERAEEEHRRERSIVTETRLTAAMRAVNTLEDARREQLERAKTRYSHMVREHQRYLTEYGT